MREQARLRATLADEPSSGYSYHDESRVETLRRGARVSTPSTISASTQPANDGVAPKGRLGKGTMVGGFVAPLVEPTPSQPARSTLSEPPEVGSWPPMPNVPAGLDAEAARTKPQASAQEEDDYDMMPTDPPKASAAVGGVIWQAVPSVIDSGGVERAAERNAPEARVAERTPATGLERAHMTPSGDRASLLQGDYADMRLARLDQLVERSAWELVEKELSSQPNLTPVLHLLHVIARREVDVVDEKKTAELTRQAIRNIADILDVPESSPTALLIAKRVLRRNPVAVHAMPASAGLSVTVLLGGLAVGAGVGWIVTKLFL